MILHRKLIVYLRRSLGKQGLSLAAQKAAVDAFIASKGGTVIETFVETETGKHSQRPELTKAIALAKRHRATIIVGKLDRLSRKASLIFNLRDANVSFVAADCPDMNELTVGLLAIVAEWEGKMISLRTREGLRVARAKGTKLGNPNGIAAIGEKGFAKSRLVRKRRADAKAETYRVIFRELDALSANQAAAELNNRNVETPSGEGSWQHTTVLRVRRRLEAA
jgi:DNA invertase Pin-like site-specific DNA recombinase